MTSPDDPLAEALNQALHAHAHQPGALLPVLHDLQDRLGHIPPEAWAPVARALRLSQAEVHGVLSYYAHFRRTPPGRRVIQVCRAESCLACGADTLLEQAEALLGCTLHHTRHDGEVTLEPVACLGLCAASPALAVNGQPHARLSPSGLEAVFSHAPPTDPSPDPLRSVSANEPPLRVWIPRDATAIALGADDVAQALKAAGAQAPRAVEVVRNGSHGLFWLEPMIEVETPLGRQAFGPVTAADLPSLLEAGLLSGGDAPARHHPLSLGPTQALSALAGQQRLTFARVGVVDPLSLEDFERHGGGSGLRQALAMTSEQIVDAVTQSGLRGRGGAAFPAGIKWRTVHAASARAPAPGGLGGKAVVCNADEGDSGTFSDRMLMEGDPYTLIEGLLIAGLAVGADTGWIYIRSEYPHAWATMTEAVSRASAAGWLGPNAAGSGRPFEIHLRRAAGSYVCGEETALLESLEGRRGIVRAKPPLPALEGLFGQPTLIHNVITLASVPRILSHGAQAYADLGSGRSRGTLPFQLAGNVARGGLYELPYGVTLRDLIFDWGGGTRSGRPVKAVQVGGPLGAYVPESHWDTPIDHEAYATFGCSVGHGGIVVHDDTADLSKLARHAMAFCAEESCGKCTPCRIGSTRGVEVIDRLVRSTTEADRQDQLALLHDLCDTMTHASLCAMGAMTPNPVRSALQIAPQDFGLPQTPATGM